MDNPKIKFYVEPKSFWAHSASILLGLASIFQLIGCWGLWSDRMTVLTQLLLPVASYLLFILVLNLLGKSALWLTLLPFLGGMAYQGYLAWNAADKLSMVIGITCCVLITVLYAGTVFILIRTKWLLVPFFAVPFLYRAFYRDVLLLQDAENPVRFADGMREMSLLCVLLAMTLLTLGIKKLVRERKKKNEQPPAEPAPAIPSPAEPSPFAAAQPETPPAAAPSEPASDTPESGAENGEV